MKTVLYYSLRRSYRTYSIVAVTSTKADRYWYGRMCPSEIPSHGKLRQLTGRFDSYERAKSCVKGVEDIYEKSQPELDAMASKMREIQTKREDHINAFIELRTNQ